MIVPFVMTPNWENNEDCGFFFTPIIGKLKVAFNYCTKTIIITFYNIAQHTSGWVTWAFLNLKAYTTFIVQVHIDISLTIGLIKRSYFGGFLVKPSPT